MFLSTLPLLLLLLLLHYIYCVYTAAIDPEPFRSEANSAVNLKRILNDVTMVSFIDLHETPSSCFILSEISE